MATDAELMALAEKATPGGASNIGASEDVVMARQSVPGTPGAVEGPIDLGSNDIAPPLPPSASIPDPVVPPIPPAPPAPPPLVTGQPTMAGAQRAIDEAAQAGMSTAQAQEGVAPAKAQERESNAQQLDKQAIAQQKQADETALKISANEVARKQAQDISAAATEKYSTMPLNGFLKDESLSHKLLGGLFVGLGMSHGAANNPALLIMNKRIEDEFKAQAAELTRKENVAKMRSEGVVSLEHGLKAGLAELGLKHAGFLDKLATEAKAQAMRNGATPEQAENNVVVQQIKQKALETKASSEEKLWAAKAGLAMAGARLAQSADKAPTQGEQENAARGRNMTLALGALEDSGMGNYVPPNGVVQKWLSNQDQIAAAAERGKSTLGQGVNFIARKADKIPANEFEGLSPKDKEYFTLVRQYLEPYARKQSGAAISSSEWQNFMNQIGPQSGKAGKALREQAARDSVTLGGRATKMLEQADAIAGRATPTVKPTPAGRRVSFKGQPGTLLPGGLFQPDGP